MKMLFGENDRYTGFGSDNLESSDSRSSVETNEDELHSKVPDSFEGGWKENRQHFKLDDSGNIVFDESYTPPDRTSGA